MERVSEHELSSRLRSPSELFQKFISAKERSERGEITIWKILPTGKKENEMFLGKY